MELSEFPSRKIGIFSARDSTCVQIAIDINTLGRSNAVRKHRYQAKLNGFTNSLASRFGE